MAKKGQKFRRYSKETKLAAVKEYLEKGTSFLELAYRYGVSSQESIVQWVENYQRYGEDAFVDKRGAATSETSPLKGRPRKKFASEEEQKKYEALVKERAVKKAQEKKRLARARKLREMRREEKAKRYTKPEPDPA